MLAGANVSWLLRPQPDLLAFHLLVRLWTKVVFFFGSITFYMEHFLVLSAPTDG